MVTSNELLFFLIQAVFLSKRRDFRECIIMSMSRSVILVCCMFGKGDGVSKEFFGDGRVEVFDVEYSEGVLVFVLYG